MDDEAENAVAEIAETLEHLEELINTVNDQLLITTAVLQVALTELARLDPRFAFSMHSATNALIERRMAEADMLAPHQTNDGRTNELLKALDFRDKVKAMTESLRATIVTQPDA